MSERVPFSAFDDLARMASAGSPGLAGATLKVQSELFAMRGEMSAAEREQFTALFLTLLPLADEATTREVAARLAAHPRTPPLLIEALFTRGTGIAEIIVERTASLSEEMTERAIGDPDPRLATRLAGRADLSAAAQFALLGRPEKTVALALSQNSAVRLDPDVAEALIGRARLDAEIGRALVRRGDIEPPSLAPIYQLAPEALRARIREEMAWAVTGRRTTATIEPAEHDRLMEASLSGLDALLEGAESLLDRGPAFTAAALADPTRELAALALVSLGIAAEDATRMLLRTGDDVARSSRQLHAVVAMMRATTRGAADLILEAMWPRLTQPRRAAMHVPVMAPGGTPSRAPAGSRRPAESQAIDKLRKRS